MADKDNILDENLANIDKNPGEELADVAIDFSETGRYHSQPGMEDEGWLEFLDILSRMLINYKHKEDKDRV